MSLRTLNKFWMMMIFGGMTAGIKKKRLGHLCKRDLSFPKIAELLFHHPVVCINKLDLPNKSRKWSNHWKLVENSIQLLQDDYAKTQSYAYDKKGSGIRDIMISSPWSPHVWAKNLEPKKAYCETPSFGMAGSEYILKISGINRYMCVYIYLFI